MKNFAVACATVLVSATLLTVYSTPAEASPYSNGNLFGAAQACGLPTAGLRYSPKPAFQSGQQTALNSRQDCAQVANTLARVTRRPARQSRVRYYSPPRAPHRNPYRR